VASSGVWLIVVVAVVGAATVLGVVVVRRRAGSRVDDPAVRLQQARRAAQQINADVRRRRRGSIRGTNRAGSDYSAAGFDLGIYGLRFVACCRV
jgi:hypothetical protein